MYVKLTNGVPTPYTIGQLRKDNPNVSFPKIVPDILLAQYDVYPLVVQDEPAHDPETQRVENGDYAEVAMPYGKQYVLQKVVIDLTADELEQRRIAKVPQIVSMRQARLALLQAGLLGQVDTAVQVADDATQIEWEYATSLDRNSTTVAMIAGATGMTDREVDDLFTAAGQL